ncbi:putative baseplate assembly protein [Terriglobus roseus]|nr:putative baseplate assembly protein [Terriglobus roseus]
MSAALSDTSLPALQGLTTRDSADFTMALLDGWAVSLDVLTFYQERLANEAYLRTAVQGRSIFELTRLVGYVPSPGVAASAVLAFTLNSAPGAPESVVIPAGTRAQSIPAPGGLPQVFETGADLQAHIGWNELPALASLPWSLAGGDTRTCLAGVSTGLQTGDALLFVAATNGLPSATGPADLRIVTAVEVKSSDGITEVSWDRALSSFNAGSGADQVVVYALRKKASLFGSQAPNPLLFTPGGITSSPGYPSSPQTDWQFQYTSGSSEVYLDSQYAGLVPSGENPQWAVLSGGGSTALLQVNGVRDLNPNLYTLTSKSTALKFSSYAVIEGAAATSLDSLLGTVVSFSRTATVYAASGQLTVANLPLRAPYVESASLPPYALDADMLVPVSGSTLTITGGQGIAEGVPIVVQGKAVRLRVLFAGSSSFVPKDTATNQAVTDNQVYLVNAYQPATEGGGTAWQVSTVSGIAGTLHLVDGSGFRLEASSSDDAVVGEAARVASVTIQGDVATLQLVSDLQGIYDVKTVTVNANTMDATHGETVHEILGNGDGTNPTLLFTLKQTPLTYVSSDSGGGITSTLQIWVNSQKWTEVANFMTSGPADRVYVTGADQSGNTFVQFGDGLRGARTPTGQSNIRAVYRKGIGSAGMVSAGQISQLLDRPQGLKGVANPSGATGGADPATPADARTSAPLPTLTLGRVVTLEDFQAYSSAFPGIGKALAVWSWLGRERGILVTISGANGTSLTSDDPVALHLLDDLRNYGTGRIPVRVVPYRPVLFSIAAGLKIDTTQYAVDDVTAQVWASLQQVFSFANREFQQGVAASDVIERIQNCTGVQAVQLQGLYRSGNDLGIPISGMLRASGPTTTQNSALVGAELLLLDPASRAGLGGWQ